MPQNPAHVVLARVAAAKHALDPALVCAVIEQESGWDAYAMRYEPGFRTRYLAPLGLPPSEEIARSISWGLLQVMGQVAREHGFRGQFLSALCEPETGIEFGCVALAAKLSLAQGDIPRALELWNGGANANYGAEVLARIPKYRAMI
jgi:soluble lytic murein transglycosylase-like protein